MRNLSRASFIRALISLMRADHLPKDPHPNTIILGVRFQHMNLGDTDHSKDNGFHLAQALCLFLSLFPSFPPSPSPSLSSSCPPSGFPSLSHWLWGSHTGCILGWCPRVKKLQPPANSPGNKLGGGSADPTTSWDDSGLCWQPDGNLRKHLEPEAPSSATAWSVLTWETAW